MAHRLKWSLLLVLIFAATAVAQTHDGIVSADREEVAMGLQANEDYEDGEALDGDDAVAEDDDDVRAKKKVKHRRSLKSAKNRHARVLEAFREELFQALELDAETAEDLGRAFAEQIEGLNDATDKSKAARREQADKVRELVSELRDAQREGDTDHVAELREEINRVRKSGSDSDFDFRGFVETLTELVYEDQVGEVERIARRYQSKFKTKKNSSADILREVRQAMAGIDLSREQHAVTREIFAEYARELREVRQDEERSQEVFENLREAILDELDDDQATRFNERLAKLRDANSSTDERRGRVRSLDLHSAAGSDVDDELIEDGEEMPVDPEVYRDENPYDDEEPEE